MHIKTSSASFVRREHKGDIVRILESTKDKTWTKEVVCSYCRSLLEVDLSDIIAYNDILDYSYGESVRQTGAKCSVCHCRFYVNVPHEIRVAHGWT